MTYKAPKIRYNKGRGQPAKRRCQDWDSPRDYSREYDRDYRREGRFVDGREYQGYGREGRERRERGATPAYYDDDEEDYSSQLGQMIRAGGVVWMQNPKKKDNKKENKELDKHTAEEWVEQMDKPDGSGKGGRWSFEEVEQLMQNRGIQLPMPDAYAAMNMLCSDYGKTLAKYGINAPEVYLELTRDWIEDDDIKAGKHKTALYYHCIVE